MSKEQLERKRTITYSWWRDSEIKEHHIEALEETAWEHIVEKLKEGYTSGDLHDNIFMKDDDIENGEEGIEYQGWWEMKTETL